MIRRFLVESFKGIRKAELELQPLNVLVGRNDTGKSTVLQALRLYSDLLREPLTSVLPGEEAIRPLLHGQSAECMIRLVAHTRSDEAAQEVTHEVTLESTGSLHAERFSCGQASYSSSRKRTSSSREQYKVDPPLRISSRYEPGFFVIAQALGTGMASWSIQHPDNKADIYDLEEQREEAEGQTRLFEQQVIPSLKQHDSSCSARYYQLFPSRLAAPAPLQVGSHPGMDPDGFGLAAYLDDLRDRHPAAFLRVVEELRWRLPGLQDILFGKVDVDGRMAKYLRFIWKGRQQAVDARHTSDGALLFLAFLTLLHSPDAPSVLLLEEPENGIHPAALRQIVAYLRALSRGHYGQPPVQVVLTTHSPLLLDWVQPEELLLCTKDEEGVVQVRPPAQLEEVRRQLGVSEQKEVQDGG